MIFEVEVKQIVQYDVEGCRVSLWVEWPTVAAKTPSLAYCPCQPQTTGQTAHEDTPGSTWMGPQASLALRILLSETPALCHSTACLAIP